MGTAYFDCTSGVSGNMVIGAMLDAGMPLDVLKEEIEKVLPRGGYGLVVERRGEQGQSFTYFNTIVPDRREQGDDFGDMTAHAAADLIAHSDLDEDVREKVIHIFRRLVSAKAKAHGSQEEESVRFRREGLTDTLIDILGTVVSLRHFGFDKVISSPLNVGSGKLLIGNRTMDIPAPMTRILLKEVPHYRDGREGELVTPTGAAIITSLAEEYSRDIPPGLSCMGAGAPLPDSGKDALFRIYRQADGGPGPGEKRDAKG